ncbi:MAG: hypothetical protein K5905_25085 [Roseibium sp.]|uniref:hypothetical protein n=1 Tax=Roseibium sp. TaxID=1936156 RepID=UPI0026148F52|nr:hypothetical protein [Roseibium sp.]MCV0428741.1 hypothetical protein [Roseibium sp.]
MGRKDPIGDKYFKPLVNTEKISGWVFWSCAALSIAALFVTTQPWKEITQTIFVILVIGNFIGGLAAKLWLSPRAEDQRRLDLLSNSFSVKLTHENAVGYFNNSEANPIQKLVLSTMESCFFTKSILSKMLPWERAKIGLYFVVWIACAVSRTADLSWIIVATQAIFSEEIIVKWLRMEWLRYKSEKIYKQIRNLVSTVEVFDNSICHAQALENFAEYETAKSRASVTLSEKIFFRLNPSLSAEWEDIKNSLKSDTPH